MLARVGAAPPEGEGWVFEPKYDGIRVLALAAPDGATLVSRNGNDKTAQFPEVAAALASLARRLRRPVVLDGELVALGAEEFGRFQALQNRIHATAPRTVAELAASQPAALVAFDLLADGDDPLVARPWRERRRKLVAALRAERSQHVRLGEVLELSGERALDEARRRGWEGVVAKKDDAPYEPGRRSSAWLKLKAENRQEFVVGGFTAPRNSREHIGSLLVGYYDGARLVYAGHVGTGFSRARLRELAELLEPLARPTSPFTTTPPTNTAATWVEPRVVVEVKFNEWTTEGVLRQPAFVGVRDDKRPRDVVREAAHGETRAAPPRPPAARRASRVRFDSVVAALERLEADGGSGTLELPDGGSLAVTNLGKKFFRKGGYTKGDLMRYYARVAPAILPAIADRPLVLRRFPNGAEGEAFYQQRAPDVVPEGVRVELVEASDGDEERRLVGGDLTTLLYLVQLGAISVDPWHGRVQAPDCADYSIVDLDPGPKAPFRRVVEVALLVKEELDALGLRAALKTSGATGLHVVLPLPAGTPAESARLVAELVATRIAERAPRIATVTRAVKARAPGAVYVDYLQNIRGKTVASVYAVRARPGATVSTPLEWEELGDGLDPRDFTIETVPARMRERGDLWARAMRRPNDLEALQEAAHAVD